MDTNELASVRTRLQRRRRAILEASRCAATAIEELRRGERDPEAAEGSQSEQLQYDLSQVGEVEQREVAQIDAAIARLDAGKYGVCRNCREQIEPRRLAALPFVLDCAGCESDREDAEAIDREAKKRPRPMMPE